MSLQCPHCHGTIAIEGTPPSEVVCPSCGSRIQLDPDATTGWLPEQAPRRLGKFELLEQLGVGSFGTVYKARDTELDRLVAIKIPRAGSIPRPEDMDRFLREARSSAPLKHPGIVSLYDAGTVDGTCYLVSEFIQGATLAERLVSRGFGFRPAAELVAAVADALHYAHERGVVHRDIKPSNVMLDLEGRPHLMDFGLAKRSAEQVTMTLEGQVLGTPAYMAPEQARGEVSKVDRRSDVYSLGVVLYELLTGELPFRGQARMLLVQVMQDEPRPPRRLNDRIPRDLETVCLKAMAKEPTRRYPSAADLADDLRRWLKGEPIQARPVGRAEKLGHWCRRNPALATALSGVILTLAVGATASAAFALAAQRAADRATANEALAHEKAREAAADRDTARAAERESRRRMVRLNIMNGTRSLEAGEPASALLWFHQAWDLDRPEADDDPSHRARLAGVLHSLPELVGVCFHRGQVCDAAFSPDGARLLARSDGGAVYLWDYERSRLTAPPLTHDSRIRHACWGPDGATVATASADGTAAVWDARSGARRHTLNHGRPVTWIAYHPRGDRLATAAEDGTIRLWDTATGQGFGGPFPTAAVVDHLAFSPDGTRLLTAGRDDVVRVWSLDPPAAVAPSLPYRASTPTERDTFHWDRWPRFGTDGRSVISFKGEDLYLWPGEGVSVKKFSLGYTITEVYPIPGTDWVLATGNRYNRVAVIRLTDGGDVYVLNHPRQAHVGTAGPDGKQLMTASSGGLIHLRVAATGELVWPPQKCGDFASAVAISPNGKRCLAASQDGTVRVWEVAPRQVEVGPYQPDNRTHYLTLPVPGGRTRVSSPDGQRVVEYGGTSPAAFSPSAPGSAPRPVSHPEPVDVVLFSDDGARFVVFGREMVRVWDARGGDPAGPPLRVATEGRGIGLDRLGRLSRDGTRVAVWDDERTVSVWDLAAGRRVFGPTRLADPGDRIFGPPEAHGQVTGLILSADGQWLAAATDSTGALTVWEVDSGRRVHHTPKRFQGYAQGFAFAADGQRLLFWASDNNSARVYETRTGEPVGPAINPPLSKERYVRVHPNECAISTDGRWLAFFESGQGAVRLYDARWADNLLQVALPSGLLPATDGTRSPISRLWFAPDGTRVSFAAGGKAYSIVIPRLDVPVEATGPLVRFLAGHRIDPTDGIERIDPATFRDDPEPFRRAFLAWKGAADDPSAQPPQFQK